MRTATSSSPLKRRAQGTPDDDNSFELPPAQRRRSASAAAAPRSASAAAAPKGGILKDAHIDGDSISLHNDTYAHTDTNVYSAFINTKAIIDQANSTPFSDIGPPLPTHGRVSFDEPKYEDVLNDLWEAPEWYVKAMRSNVEMHKIAKEADMKYPSCCYSDDFTYSEMIKFDKEIGYTDKINDSLEQSLCRAPETVTFLHEIEGILKVRSTPAAEKEPECIIELPEIDQAAKLRPMLEANARLLVDDPRSYNKDSLSFWAHWNSFLGPFEDEDDEDDETAPDPFRSQIVSTDKTKKEYLQAVSDEYGDDCEVYRLLEQIKDLEENYLSKYTDLSAVYGVAAVATHGAALTPKILSELLLKRTKEESNIFIPRTPSKSGLTPELKKTLAELKKTLKARKKAEEKRSIRRKKNGEEKVDKFATASSSGSSSHNLYKVNSKLLYVLKNHELINYEAKVSNHKSKFKLITELQRKEALDSIWNAPEITVKAVAKAAEAPSFAEKSQKGRLVEKVSSLMISTTSIETPVPILPPVNHAYSELCTEGESCLASYSPTRAKVENLPEKRHSPTKKSGSGSGKGKGKKGNVVLI